MWVSQQSTYPVHMEACTLLPPAVHKAGVDPGIWETEKGYQKFKVIIVYTVR